MGAEVTTRCTGACVPNQSIGSSGQGLGLLPSAQTSPPQDLSSEPPAGLGTPTHRRPSFQHSPGRCLCSDLTVSLLDRSHVGAGRGCEQRHAVWRLTWGSGREGEHCPLRTERPRSMQNTGPWTPTDADIGQSRPGHRELGPRHGLCMKDSWE